MKQITKFYLASFLKNQTYFTPIIVLFLLANGLNYQQVFWVFTIGAIFSLLIEIPTGIIADLFGKRMSIIVAKFLIFIAYVAYGLSGSFWMFVLSQLILEAGNAFRSGTETAYVYDYLAQHKLKKYTEVKGKQKFYARVSEAVGAGIGGIAAGWLLGHGYGYGGVFLIAAIPAFVNFVYGVLWEKIEERRERSVSARKLYRFTLNSFSEIIKKRHLLVVVLNITVFATVIASLDKFVQPYMIDAGIRVEAIGFIYSIFLTVTAFLVRYSYLVGGWLGTRKTINCLSLIAFIPAFILGLGHVSIFGVMLFFFVIFIENVRSPIANNEFHESIGSQKRATLGSILELSKSLGKVIVLPIVGYLAENLGISPAILMLSGVLLLNGLFFWIRKPA